MLSAPTCVGGGGARARAHGHGGGAFIRGARRGVRAQVALVNPTAGALADAAFAVDLYYAGFGPGDAVDVWRVAPGAQPALVRSGAVVGRDAGVGVYEVALPLSLPPTSYAFYVVKPSA